MSSLTLTVGMIIGPLLAGLTVQYLGVKTAFVVDSATFLAAAGLYALDHHVERLTEDHAKARILGECLAGQAYVSSVAPVQTNIVVFELVDSALGALFISELLDKGVQAISLGQGKLRLVAHLDVSREDIDRACDILSGIRLA